MEELLIYKFQAEQIEDTLRVVANILDSRKKTSCIDRDIMQSIEMIKKGFDKNIETFFYFYIV